MQSNPDRNGIFVDCPVPRQNVEAIANPPEPLRRPVISMRQSIVGELPLKIATSFKHATAYYIDPDATSWRNGR
jgi:hypothetical protein